MDKPEDFARRVAQQLLWIRGTISRHYKIWPEGQRKAEDSDEFLHIALTALERPAEARHTARILARQAPKNSDLQNDLDAWWIENLKADREKPCFTMLVEALDGCTTPKGVAWVQEFSGTLMGNERFALPAAQTLFRQLELGHKAAKDIRAVLEDNAGLTVQNTSTGSLPGLLRGCYEHNLPRLKQAALGRLPEMELPMLVRWDHKLRHEPDQAELRSQIKAAYISGLNGQGNASPALAWNELQTLEGCWQRGEPTIISRPETPVAAIFTNYARSEPRMAALHAARAIRAAGNTRERQEALEEAHVRISELSPATQLAFLGKLHNHLWNEPDLAGGNRKQILRLNTACPGAADEEQLYADALGDDVLRNTLRPVVGEIPVRIPMRTQLKNWARRRLGLD